MARKFKNSMKLQDIFRNSDFDKVYMVSIKTSPKPSNSTRSQQPKATSKLRTISLSAMSMVGELPKTLRKPKNSTQKHPKPPTRRAIPKKTWHSSNWQTATRSNLSSGSRKLPLRATLCVSSMSGISRKNQSGQRAYEQYDGSDRQSH